MSLPKPDCLKPPWGMSDVIGMWSFTHTVPKSRAFAARMALNTSAVQTELARPSRAAAAADRGGAGGPGALHEAVDAVDLVAADEAAHVRPRVTGIPHADARH